MDPDSSPLLWCLSTFSLNTRKQARHKATILERILKALRENWTDVWITALSVTESQNN